MILAGRKIEICAAVGLLASFNHPFDKGEIESILIWLRAAPGAGLLRF